MRIETHLDEALERGLHWVRQRQRADGSWSLPVRDDPRATAIYLNCLRFLGRAPGDAGREMERDLASRQCASGAWEAWPGDGGDSEVTALCAMALEGAATDAGRAAETRARAWLDSRPAPRIDGFWLGTLAMSGAIDWADVPYMSPRLVSLPTWLHPNLTDFGVIRLSLVAMSVVLYERARRGQPAAEAAPPWRRRWAEAARRVSRGPMVRLTQGLRRLDLRLAATARHRDRALTWLLARQEPDGSFFSSLHMTSAALMALHVSDPERYADNIEAGLQALRSWQHPTRTGLRQSFTDSTIWDTALYMQILQEVGGGEDAARLARGGAFLMQAQTFEEADCMARMASPERGGWGFQRVARHYPDVDDTTVSLGALLPLAQDNPAWRAPLGQAVAWLLAMQGSNGGWASWDRNDRGWIRVLQGGRWFLRDTPCPVLTARAAHLLGRIGRGEFPGLEPFEARAAAAARRGHRFVARQRRRGLWLCRWFTHYTYGSLYGLDSALEAGLPVDRDGIVGWFASIAQPDGGFGESPAALEAGQFLPAPSTPFHTAVALLAFVRAGQSRHPAATRAARWLIAHQDPDGRWQNEDLFAAGIPGVWYTNFSGTPHYYALRALAQFKHGRAAIAG
ncbi:MAG: hypothetical protein GYB53_03730 [Rhodobacteraceae bacterium]|nr:hypothetical protein [Paracoccaceae bacterium]MBR9822842.1 hypothetical protein [Paracoccaceae bacterium]